MQQRNKFDLASHLLTLGFQRIILGHEPNKFLSALLDLFLKNLDCFVFSGLVSFLQFVRHVLLLFQESIHRLRTLQKQVKYPSS
jgi:hypothetical protein